MVVDEWVIDPRQYRTWNITTKIGNTYYRVMVYVDRSDKTVKYWYGMSSGKKRKHLDIYEEKPEKADGGIKALLWAIRMMHEFTEIYMKMNKGWLTTIKAEYICIKWSDSRRREIYKRLENQGFSFRIDGSEKILMKKL